MLPDSRDSSAGVSGSTGISGPSGVSGSVGSPGVSGWDGIVGVSESVGFISLVSHAVASRADEINRSANRFMVWSVFYHIAKIATFSVLQRGALTADSQRLKH